MKYEGLGWYVHLSEKNYRRYGINPKFASMSLSSAVKMQQSSFLYDLNFNKNNFDLEKINNFLQGVQPNITGKTNEFGVTYEKFSQEDEFAEQVEKLLGQGNWINEDFTVTESKFQGKYKGYKEYVKREQATKRTVDRLIKELENVVKQCRMKLAYGEISKSEANAWIQEAQSYKVELLNKIDKEKYKIAQSDLVRVLKNKESQGLIQYINDFVRLFNASSNPDKLGKAGELAAYYSFLALKRKINNTTKELIEMVGTKSENLSIDLGKNFTQEEKNKLAQSIQWTIGTESGIISTNSTGTVDILIQDKDLLDYFNSSSSLRVSMKNYTRDNEIKIFSKASLLSFLSIFELPFANHYLNLLVQKKENTKKIQETLKLGAAYRGLSGYRGLSFNKSQLNRANLLIINTPKNGMQAYPIEYLLNQVSQNLNLIDLNIDPIPTNLNQREGSKINNLKDARQRIIKLLADIQKIKLSASLKVGKIKNF